MSDSADDDGLSEVARAIWRYLDTRPHAADSLDGVVRWWLARQRYADSASAVQAALDELEARGLVAHRRLFDGRIVYERRTKQDGEDMSP